MKKLLILFLSTILLSGCTLFGTVFGPYHHSAYVNRVQEVADLNGRSFCLINNKVFELKKETFMKIDLGITGPLRHIKAYNGKLYIRGPSGINVFNANLEKEEDINIYAGSFLVDDNYIYYVNLQGSSYDDLYAYDLESGENILLTTKLVNDTYVFNNKILYVNDAQNIFDVTSDLDITSYFFEVLDNGEIKTGGNTNPSFYANGSTGKIYWKKGKLTINYADESYEYALNEINVIYGAIHTKTNKVIFATYEYLEHDDCNNDLDCICHFGTNYIWSFDVETKNITKLKEFDEGTYLISFDENSYCYYKEGKVYRNNNEVRNVNKIEPYGKYTQIGGETSVNYRARVSDTFFYDDGTTIYHHYFDYRSTLQIRY